MYKIFTLIHSEKFFFVAFLLKHSTRIHQWLYFNLKSTGTDSSPMSKFIYFYGGLRRFQHCIGHITTGRFCG